MAWQSQRSKASWRYGASSRSVAASFVTNTRARDLNFHSASDADRRTNEVPNYSSTGGEDACNAPNFTDQNNRRRFRLRLPECLGRHDGFYL